MIKRGSPEYEGRKRTSCILHLLVMNIAFHLNSSLSLLGIEPNVRPSTISLLACDNSAYILMLNLLTVSSHNGHIYKCKFENNMQWCLFTLTEVSFVGTMKIFHVCFFLISFIEIIYTHVYVSRLL